MAFVLGHARLTYTTPRDVMGAPPSSLTVPPSVTVVADVTALVLAETLGGFTRGLVRLNSTQPQFGVPVATGVDSPGALRLTGAPTTTLP
jgi:hypothetical protein